MLCRQQGAVVLESNGIISRIGERRDGINHYYYVV